MQIDQSYVVIWKLPMILKFLAALQQPAEMTLYMASRNDVIEWLKKRPGLRLAK